MRLTVCGSFGFGNAGDEAIPLAISDMLEEIGEAVELDVLCRYDFPEMDGVIGLGADYADKRSSLKSQPMLMAGGGIIEAASYSTIKRCSGFFRNELKAKMAFLGISADYGVRYRWLDRVFFSFWMRKTGTVYARDVLSASTIQSNFPRVSVETIGDLVLWMKPSICPEHLSDLPQRYISVVLAPRWQDPHWVEWISSELATLAKQQHAALVFVPMSCQHDDDRVEHKRVAAYISTHHPEVEAFTIETPLSPREVAAVLGKSLSTVSMRLHGCVMAYAQKIPFVALAYHPKLAGFVQTIEVPWAILPFSLPKQQSCGVYGYRFSDLQLCGGDLVRSVERARNEMSFELLERLKQRSLGAFKKFITS